MLSRIKPKNSDCRRNQGFDCKAIMKHGKNTGYELLFIFLRYLKKSRDMCKSNNTSKINKTLSGRALSKSSPKSSSTLSQVRNVRTGHIITRDSGTGQYTNIGNKPIHGMKVITVFKSASNPSITRETAELAEKAVLAVKNKSSKK